LYFSTCYHFILCWLVLFSSDDIKIFYIFDKTFFISQRLCEELWNVSIDVKRSELYPGNFMKSISWEKFSGGASIWCLIIGALFGFNRKFKKQTQLQSHSGFIQSLFIFNIYVFKYPIWSDSMQTALRCEKSEWAT
jgi:hypothetical protein